MEKIILIKYGEIGLKGNNRSDFEKQLARNITRATGVPSDAVQRVQGRIVVSPEKEEDIQWILSALPHVFGVHSFVPAYVTERTFDAISEACKELIPNEATNKTFRISARRSAKDFEMSSQELNEKLGGVILEQFPTFSVKLRGPDHTVHVEIHKKCAYVYSREQEIHGPGGLPVGVSESALVSLSGGIDSPVATWLAMKRGMKVDALHFESFPFTGKKAQEKVFELARKLSAWKTEPIIVYMVSFTKAQKVIASGAPEPYLTVLFKRSMQRIAARIAEIHGYKALITGESLAQVASQTLENIKAVESAADLLTLRPLVTFDKQETIELARRIGTYEISIQPHEDCCTVFTPSTPRTKTKTEKLEEIESTLELSEIEARAAQNAKIYAVSQQKVEERY